MIGLDGAGLIATIIPIALLVISFEIHRAPTIYGATVGGTVALWFLGAVFVAGVGLGLWVELLLIRSVATQSPLTAVESSVVWIALYLLGYGAGMLMMGSLLERLGVLDRVSTWAGRRTMSSPRRLHRKVDYIRRHHPSARDPE